MAQLFQYPKKNKVVLDATEVLVSSTLLLLELQNTNSLYIVSYAMIFITFFLLDYLISIIMFPILVPLIESHCIKVGITQGRTSDLVNRSPLHS